MVENDIVIMESVRFYSTAKLTYLLLQTRSCWSFVSKEHNIFNVV